MEPHAQLGMAERMEWAHLARRCAELHVRWYSHDQREPRPLLFDHWRPLCPRAGLPPESGIFTWHELEISVRWHEPTVDLRVVIPDGTRLSVTDQKGAWNDVAREALVQLQQLLEELEGEAPAVGARNAARDPRQRAARARLSLAHKIMKRRLDHT